MNVTLAILDPFEELSPDVRELFASSTVRVEQDGTHVIDVPTERDTRSCAPHLEAIQRTSGARGLVLTVQGVPFSVAGPATTATKTSDDDESDLDWRSLPIPADTFLYHYLETAERSYEPMAWHLANALVLLGLAVGNRVTWRDRSPVRANLYTALVGRTGDGKDNSTRLMVQTLLATDIDVERLTSPASGVALIRDMAGEVTSTTGREATYAGNVTAWLQEPELSRFVKAGNRGGVGMQSTDMGERVIQFYDGGPVGNHAASTGRVVAADHFLSITAGVQPERLPAMFAADDVVSGLLNRWFFVYGYTSKSAPARCDELLVSSSAVSALRRVHDWSKPGLTVRDADAATNQELERFFVQVRADRERIGPLGKRLDLFAKKLLLLFAINERSSVTTTEHIVLLEQLWPTIVGSYERLSSGVGKSELERVCDAVLLHMGRHAGKLQNSGCTPSQLREIAKPIRRFDPAIVRRAFETLASLGDLGVQTFRSESTNQRTTRYFLPTWPIPKPKETP